jgi:hypothetical protein
VISTHRLNYVGGVFSENADKGLRQLEELLTSITRKWPDVRFESTNYLSELLRNDQK